MALNKGNVRRDNDEIKGASDIGTSGEGLGPVDDFSMDETEMQSLMQEILKIQQDSGSGKDDSEAVKKDGAEPSEPEQEKPKSYVRVAKDQMEAWVYLSSDSGPVSRNALLSFLKDNNVMRGYVSNTFTRLVKDPVYDRELIIASGKAPDEGRDGYYEYFFEPEKYNVPSILEDGSVDYSSMNRLANVHAGDVVAMYHPAVQGHDGFNVAGDTIKAHVTRELPPMYGKEIGRDGNRYYTKVDGKIEEHHGHVDIQQVHEVHGDVGGAVGKIEFFGDVIIYGNVESGAVIRAGRNIDIRGTASDATLSAGGDIIVTRGITCSTGGKVTARGNLMSDFIENARVEVQGNITTNSLLNSYVSAGGEVDVCGKNSVIIGGYTHGFRKIKAANVGNDTEKKTILHSGYEVNLYDNYIGMKRRESEIKNEMSSIVTQIMNEMQNQRIVNLKKQSVEQDDDEKKDSDELENENFGEKTVTVAQRISEWKKQKNSLFTELEQIRPVREKLEEKIMLAQQAKIEVSGHVYSGTIVALNDKKMVIQKDNSFMRYSIKYGTIDSEVMIL